MERLYKNDGRPYAAATGAGRRYTRPVHANNTSAAFHPGPAGRRAASRARRRVSRTALRAGLVALAALTLGAATIDDAILDQGADLAYRRALAPAGAPRRPPVDAEITARTRRVVNRVAATAPAVSPDARGFAWAVTVVAHPEPSLVVFPRGRVVVNDALVATPGWADEELAAIVAHAIAHSLLGHDTQRIAQRAGAALEAADPNRRALAVADAAEALRTTRYTREELAAADALMIDLLVQAAYDPRAAGSAWRRARGVRPIAERMPIDDERLAAIDAAARAAIPRYEDVRAKAAAQGGGVRIPAGAHRAR